MTSVRQRKGESEVCVITRKTDGMSAPSDSKKRSTQRGWRYNQVGGCIDVGACHQARRCRVLQARKQAYNDRPIRQ